MDIIRILQIITAVLLMLSILSQSRGAGLSGVFGGAGNVYMAKRGFEKKIFYATIVLSVIFFGLSIVAILI